MSIFTASLPRALCLKQDEHGSVLVEFTMLLVLLFTLTLGFVDLSYALYQWNAASKAVERGARLAAVSNPVASGITSLSGVGGSVKAGDPMPAFSATCSGAGASCSCGGALTICTYSSAAMSDIVFGRGQSTCGTFGADGTAGMCDIFGRIAPANVTITYTGGSGLGFAGRPGSATATVKVEVTGLTFTFFFLNGILGFPAINMPALTTTVTGEDLSSTSS